ncbi:MAG: histidine phosphatase family protein [Candidatus Omnitrophota bacterium]|jgi:broad specificity phosphatase PhoE
MMLTQLVLIRHGITEWNKQRRYCGRKDIPLSRQGRAQAKQLSKKLEAFKIEKIYSSDRKRALQTSRIIFGRRKIITMKVLREINFGVLEGLRHEDILKKYGAAYKKWLVNPYKSRIPQAETMVAFKKRVNRAIKKIVRFNPGKKIAIVCHGGVIGIFVSSVLNSNNFWRYVPAAASFTIVEYKKSRPIIKKFNQIEYLR